MIFKQLGTKSKSVSGVKISGQTERFSHAVKGKSWVSHSLNCLPGQCPVQCPRQVKIFQMIRGKTFNSSRSYEDMVMNAFRLVILYRWKWILGCPCRLASHDWMKLEHYCLELEPYWSIKLVRIESKFNLMKSYLSCLIVLGFPWERWRNQRLRRHRRCLFKNRLFFVRNILALE